MVEMSSEDVFVWPDGSWCYREDAHGEFSWKSDDYYVIYFDTQEWQNFLLEEGEWE